MSLKVQAVKDALNMQRVKTSKKPVSKVSGDEPSDSLQAAGNKTPQGGRTAPASNMQGSQTMERTITPQSASSSVNAKPAGDSSGFQRNSDGSATVNGKRYPKGTQEDDPSLPKMTATSGSPRLAVRKPLYTKAKIRGN
jgi:hypothetical protein